MFGPESTGKTTLASQLASYFKTRWVPEYAREYLQNKWNREQKPCEIPDLIPIAQGQIALENKEISKANHVLFCDTDLLTYKVYSEVYFNGYVPPLLEKYALQNQYDLYLLLHPDVPWEPDDLRDKPLEREWMFRQFKEALQYYNRPFQEVYGTGSERLKRAISIITNTLKS